MTIVNIIGGLGNQMFQYAFAYTLSKKKKTKVKLDTNNFETYDLRKYELNLLDVSLEIATTEEVNKVKYNKENLFQNITQKIRRKSLATSNNHYKEPHFNFDEKVYDTKGNIYFDGYWQSEKYIKEYREELLKQFTLKNNLHSLSQKYIKDIEDIDAVSLHIRRGDYVTDTHTNSVHGTCTLDYYRDAVSTIKEKIKNAHFFIFSDDLGWAKEYIDFIEYITFIELGNDIPDHEEMYLMSLCKHNIIANSSFSWWGAWLNQNPKKIVIAPKQWFNDPSINTSDLIPEGWIRL